MALSVKRVFINAIAWQESGGHYGVVNQSSGALGKYQVMPANLPGWLRQAGMRPMTAWQYLHDDVAQDTLAWRILGGYFDRWGARGAAAVWYSGQPNWRATYGNPPVYVYVNSVVAIMTRISRGQVVLPGGGGGGGGQGVPQPNTPGAGSLNYSGRVRAAASRHQAAARAMMDAANALHRL